MKPKNTSAWSKGDLNAILDSNAGLAAVQNVLQDLLGDIRVVVTLNYAADERSGMATLDWPVGGERQSSQVSFQVREDDHGEDYLDFEWPSGLRDWKPLFVEGNDAPIDFKIDFEPVEWNALPPVVRHDPDSLLDPSRLDVPVLSAASEPLLELLADDEDDDEEESASSTPPPKKASLTVDRTNGVVIATVRPNSIADDAKEFFGLLTVSWRVKERADLTVRTTKKLLFRFDKKHTNGLWSGELRVDLPRLTFDGFHKAQIRPLQPSDLMDQTDVNDAPVDFKDVHDRGRRVSMRRSKAAPGRQKKQHVLVAVKQAEIHREDAGNLNEALRELLKIGEQLTKLRAENPHVDRNHPLEKCYLEQFDILAQDHYSELLKELNRRCAGSQHVEDGISEFMVKLLEKPLSTDHEVNLKSYFLQGLVWEVRGRHRQATKETSRGMAGRGSSIDEDPFEFIAPGGERDSSRLWAAAAKLLPEERSYWEDSQEFSHRDIAKIRSRELTIDQIKEHKTTLTQRWKQRSPDARTTDAAFEITDDAIVDLVAERLRPLQDRVKRNLLWLMALSDLRSDGRISEQEDDVFCMTNIHKLNADEVTERTQLNRKDCKAIIDRILPKVEAAAALMQLSNNDLISESDQAAVATWLIPVNTTSDSGLTPQDKHTLGSKVHAQILAIRERTGRKPLLGDHARRWLERIVLQRDSSVNVAKALVSFERPLPNNGPESIEAISEFVEKVWNEQESLVPRDDRVFNNAVHAGWVHDVEQARELAAAAEELRSKKVLEMETFKKLEPWIRGEKEYSQLRKPETISDASNQPEQAEKTYIHYLKDVQLQQIGTQLHGQILLNRQVFTGAAQVFVEQAVLLQQPISVVLELPEFRGMLQDPDGSPPAEFLRKVAEQWQANDTLVPATHRCLDVAASLSSG